MVFIFTLLYAHHHVTVHLQKPSIRIPGEPRVSALFGHNLNDVIVHAEVENCIHHSRHRIARTGTYRQKQRIAAIAELFANRFFNFREREFDLFVQVGWICPLILSEIRANLCADREPRGNWEADLSHFVQVCAFPAEERFHFAIPVGFAITEIIDVTDFLCVYWLLGRPFCLDRHFLRRSLLHFSCHKFMFETENWRERTVRRRTETNEECSSVNAGYRGS